MIIFAFLIFPLLIPAQVFALTNPTSSHILISQFAAGIGNANEEFVEIYNPSASTFDLKAAALRLRRRSGTGSDSLIKDFATLTTATIPANGFYLLATSTNATLGVPLDVSISPSITSNGTLWLAISASTDPASAIDRVSHGTISDPLIVDHPAVALQTNQFLSRKNCFTQDTDDSLADFTFYASTSGLILHNSHFTSSQTLTVQNNSSQTVTQPDNNFIQQSTITIQISTAVTVHTKIEIATAVVVNSSPTVSQLVPMRATKIIGRDGGVLVLNGQDGSSEIEIPPGALDVPEMITISFDPSNPAPPLNLQTEGQSNQPLARYVFQPEGLTFAELLTFRLHYPATVTDRSRLKVFMKEGNRWSFQGGKANDSGQVVFKSNRLAEYAIFTPQVSQSNLADRKFITPNGDGKNDSAFWPESVWQVTVYNASGIEVWSRKSGVDERIAWNGQDAGGNSVESGAYLYRTESEKSERSYGIIIVLK